MNNIQLLPINPIINGKIYKAVCSHCNHIYIGSTTQSLCNRIANHKSDSGTLEIQKFSPGGQLDGTVFQILHDGVIYQFQSSRDFYYVTGDPNQSKRFDGEAPGLPVDRIGLYHYRDASGIQRTLPAYKFRK